MERKEKTIEKKNIYIYIYEIDVIIPILELLIYINIFSLLFFNFSKINYK